MDVLTIGILGVLAYFALQDRQADEQPGGNDQQLPGFNPNVSIEIFSIEEAKNDFEIKLSANFPESLTPDGKDFKNNRVAGSLFYGNQEIAIFRDASNFTLRNDGKQRGTIVKIRIPKTFNPYDYNFWLNVRAVGDFEAKDKSKIYFNNPIGLGGRVEYANPLEGKFSDLYKFLNR